MSNPFDLLKFNATLKNASSDVIKQFENIFPDFVIEEWKTRGFANYMNGLLITTNPNDYYDIIEDWVEEPQKCHVIMRTAFGSFYYLKGDTFYSKSVVHNLSSDLRKRFDLIIEFSLCNKGNQKNILYKEIYDKAVKRLGAPKYDEVFAFVPAIALGGNYNPDTIQKVQLKEHLSILAQLI